MQYAGTTANIALAILYLLFTGCGHTPERPAVQPVLLQQMEAAGQWDLLAEDVAGQVIDFLESQGNPGPVSDRDISVQTASDAVREVFGAGLVKQLARTDRDISGSGGRSLYLNASIQPIKHRADIFSRGLSQAAVEIAPGISVLRNVPFSWVPQAETLSGLWKESTLTRPFREIFITTRVSSNRGGILSRDDVLMQKTDLYILGDAEEPQFPPPDMPLRRFELTDQEIVLSLDGKTGAPSQTPPPSPGEEMPPRQTPPVEESFKLINETFFGVGQHSIDTNAQVELDKVIWFLKEYPSVSVEIRGHTDRSGDMAYNQDLSERRALAVKRYLMENGIAPDRIVARGFGAESPKSTASSVEGRKENRRAEILSSVNIRIDEKRESP